MNKRDFYKEIMSEYMFDKDKILANAKKGKIAEKKALPLYIGMTAAAAAVVVTVGSVTMSLAGRRGAEYLQSNGTDLAALSEQERIDRALEEIRKNENSSDPQDVYVSFTRSLTPAEAQSVITEFSDGSVPVKMLYMADGSRALGSSEVSAVFNGGDGEINGAVINCAGYLISKLNNNPNVFLAEIVTDKDWPDMPPLTNDQPNTPISDDPMTNNSGDTSNGGTSDNNPGGMIGDNTHSVPSTSDIDGDTSNTSDPDAPDVSSSEQSNTSSDSAASSVPSETTSEKLPEGVKLPESYEKFSYITDDIGAERTYFLTDNIYYVKSANEVRLYKWNGENETLLAAQAAADAKVCWISEDGSRMMITGVENGVRGKMYILDANNGTISDMHVENIVYGGSIIEAAYNETYDMLAINVLEDGTNYIYTANLAGYTAANENCAASGEGLSILAAKNSALYYSEYDGETTTIRKYTGNYSEIATLSGAYSSTFNSAFTHAVISGSERYILDPDSDTLVPVAGSGDISFGISANSFSLGDSCYTVQNGTLTPVKTDAALLAKIDFKRGLSSKYMALVSNGSVRIVPSTYSAKAMSETLTFGTPTESATAAQRSAVNAGLGAINAIAGNALRECGIDTPEKLSETIRVCFTKSAGSVLKTRCGIADGSLSCTSGGLSQVNISDTVLVMNSSTSGTLYIKAGTFNGKTGYFTRNVTLAEENGKLRLDCIIE